MQLVRLVIVVVLSLMLMTDWSQAWLFGPGKCMKMRQVVAVFVVVVVVVVFFIIDVLLVIVCRVRGARNATLR